MKLIIDIGNSVVKMVAFQGDEPVDEIRAENGDLTGLDAFVSKHNFRSGIVGSVRGLTRNEEEALARLQFPLLRFSHDTPIPISNRYRTPETLGSDRLAAVIGASSLMPGKDLLIIDAGTCITYEVIDARGNYWGGNIAPGMQMRLRALHEYTARLPLVEAEGVVPGMGYDTETAIRSGVLRGMKYEIEGYIKSMRSKFPHLQVFLTGGNRINFDEDIRKLVFTDKYIVPRGLNRILDYNEELRVKNEES
ncbi:MAG: type III pantothenate kinase [Bacteroidaceae bacterium]|nr:type III pantothenate kinase [Bacteroidaceae bacterium]